MRYLGILAAVLLLAGCETFSIHNYSLSNKNTDAIISAMNTGRVSSIAVGEFSASSPGQFELSCGTNKQIRTPQHIPFEKYVREALIAELKKADAYSLDQIEADRVITGHLDKFRFNADSGGWDIDLTIRFRSGESFTVTESYLIDSTSCQDITAAALPAVQDLIYKVITHPTFQKKMGVTAN
jgi:hypothetical protein